MLKLTPAGWLDLLLRKLDEQWRKCVVFDAYFEGDQALKFATAKWQAAFGQSMGTVVSNWCPLVVDASAERIEVQGFRFSEGDAADTAAWDIWQANLLDSSSDRLHEEAIKLGGAFWMVEPPASPDDAPIITVEHPSQVYVLTDAGNPHVRLAAIKRWWGEDGHVYANVYLPTDVFKFRTVEPSKSGLAQQYQRRIDDPGGRNALGRVPAIPVLNEPALLYGGRSDLRNVLPLQDALNKLLADMLIGSEYQAYPQRVLLGVEVPKDENGKPLAGLELTSSQSRLWAFENENAKVAEFSPDDLKAFVSAREHIIAELIAQQRIPSYYVAGGQIVNVSESALKVLDAGLVKRVQRKLRSFGESHEEMMRLAFLAIGDTQRAAATDMQTIWRNPEIRSEAEMADALAKLKSINVPDRFLWERYGFTPQEIARMEAMQDAQALLDSVTAPDPSVDAAVPGASQ